MTVTTDEVFLIETFNGEVLTHSKFGPMCFTDRDKMVHAIEHGPLKGHAALVVHRNDLLDVVLPAKKWSDTMNLPDGAQYVVNLLTPGMANTIGAGLEMEELDDDIDVEPEPEEPIVSDIDMKRAYLISIGGKVDKRWGLNRLDKEIARIENPTPE